MRRKSTAEKQLTGTFRADRYHTGPKFAAPPGATVKPPAWIKSDKVALAEWKRVVPLLLAENILRQTDLTTLGSYCVLFSRWRQAAEDVQTRGQVLTITSTTRTGRTDRPAQNPSCRLEVLYANAMAKVSSKFGLSPTDRGKVDTSPAVDEEDELERFLRS